MTEVVLYHHVQGLTEGVRSFAGELAQAGHTVHTPDMFDGRAFGTIGGHRLRARGGLRRPGRARAGRRRGNARRGRLCRLLVRGHGRSAARPVPARSPRRLADVCLPPGLGVRRGVAGARPGADPRQGHRSVLRRRPRGRAGPGRLDRPGRAVSLPGEDHLFADSSLPAYDPAAAALLTERVLAFLAIVQAGEET